MKTQNLTDLSRMGKKKKKYPYLGRYSSLEGEKEMLVLFSGVKEGVMLSTTFASESNEIGKMSTCWAEEGFEEVTAVIEFVKED